MLLVVFQFNADCKISKEDRHYNTNPTLNDKVHILVCVIDANTTSLIKSEVLMGIQDIRDEASELGECKKTLFTHTGDEHLKVTGDRFL